MKLNVLFLSSLLALTSIACGGPDDGADADVATSEDDISISIFNRISPDLTGRYDGGGWATISNRGASNTPWYKVWVLANAQSYSFWYYTPGTTGYSVDLGTFECGQLVTVILDAENHVSESVESNNVFSFYGACQIDPGTNLVPAED